MKAILLIPLFILFIFSSCHQEKKMTPVEYNDIIISEQSKIIEITLELVENLDQDIELCEKNRVDIIKQCDSSLIIIKNLEAYNGNSRLKNSAIKLFAFYKKVYSTDYKILIDILRKGENITEDDMDQMSQIATKIELEEKDIESDFLEAQSEFAEENKIQMEENKLQKKIDSI